MDKAEAECSARSEDCGTLIAARSEDGGTLIAARARSSETGQFYIKSMPICGKFSAASAAGWGAGAAIFSPVGKGYRFYLVNHHHQGYPHHVPLAPVPLPTGVQQQLAPDLARWMLQQEDKSASRF